LWAGVDIFGRRELLKKRGNRYAGPLRRLTERWLRAPGQNDEKGAAWRGFAKARRLSPWKLQSDTNSGFLLLEAWRGMRDWKNQDVGGKGTG